MSEERAAKFTSTRAFRHLCRWRRQPEHTAELLAGVCGVREGTARRWLAGRARPPEHLRGPVYVLTGALPYWWRTPAEQTQNTTAMRRAKSSADGEA